MAGKFILHVLGTASAKPTLKRASSAQLLQAAECLFLIDCSEGTQERILHQNMKIREWTKNSGVQAVKRLSKSTMDAIFISHIHGDHMFGLFPLLNTMALSGRTKPLKIFGPNALGSVINFYSSFWGAKDTFKIDFVPLKMKKPETVLELSGVTVQAFPLNHGVDTFGFIFREDEHCTFKKEPYRPRSFAYCSDTAPFPELEEWVKGVDLLYHEATYLKSDFRKAHDRFHSTTADAAACAAGACAGRLVVGHYSSSLKEEDIHSVLEAELREVFPNSSALDDGDIIEIPMQTYNK